MQEDLEEGKTILSLDKRQHDKSGIAESLRAYINRARLTAYEVDIF